MGFGDSCVGDTRGGLSRRIWEIYVTAREPRRQICGRSPERAIKRGEISEGEARRQEGKEGRKNEEDRTRESKETRENRE
ncbi:hypothetical protein SK128_003308, partial [Halocaridina rubra]